MNFPTCTTVFWWKPAAWLRISGSDAANFLQGQFSNDLRLLAEKSAVYGFWLNVKGKVVADSFVLRGTAEGEFWIGSYESSATVIRERLESFIISDDVVIEDFTEAWSAVSLFGEGIGRESVDPTLAGFRFGGRRGHGESIEWIFPVTSREASGALLAGRGEVSAAEIARWRIAAGIPAVPRDLGPGDLPNESGLEADAISYTKGCYLGQEVMARLKSMGQVRRRLMRVAFAIETAPPTPAPLFLGLRQVGELRSVAPDGSGGFVGLAMVSTLHVKPGAPLAFASEASAIINVIDPR